LPGLFLVAALLACVPAGGCGGAARRCGTPPAPTCQMVHEDLGRALAARVGGAPDKAVNVLVLSGGGSYGAWGAGVLKGWRDNTLAPRPKFDVVTGVSTGA